MTPEKPANETLRLAALQRLHALGGESNESVEAIVDCAKIALRTPVALISLVEADRQVFLCRIGIDVTETPREVSFCAHAIHTSRPFIVPDARLDPRFAENPLVTGPPHIRSYLGMPLITSDGSFAIGSLCVIDFEPRQWTPEEIVLISRLGTVAMALIELGDIERDLREPSVAA